MTIRVRVQPRARRAGVVGLVDGVDGPRLKRAVNAAPADGQANRAVCAMMAAVLGVPASTVSIAQGGAARDKLLSIAGAPALLGPRLEALA